MCVTPKPSTPAHSVGRFRKTVPASEQRAKLVQERLAFQAKMQAAGAAQVWQNFSGRIAAVLSGGGARGAYEVGALLAFQDAGLPTHILAGSSVGSINAASYAAHSRTTVGNAESLLASWSDLSPDAVGIEWTNYAWMLTGLIAATAGFVNLIRHALHSRGLILKLHDPALTWLFLGLAGVVVLVFYDQLPYLGYVIRSLMQKNRPKPDRRKAAKSALANVIVWSFVLIIFHSLYIGMALGDLFHYDPKIAALTFGGLIALVVLGARLRTRLNRQIFWLLRLPLRTGLFANFERSRFLRRRISIRSLRASPIRAVFTATDLESGTASFFSNTPREELASDPGVDTRFAFEEVVVPEDLMSAVVASSAIPIVYQPLKVGRRLYIDGAMVTNQPIRPAVRLGADVLFLVMMQPPTIPRSEVKTFIDVGLRSLEILMAQNLATDLKILSTVNAMCERAAAEFGLTPEEVEIDFGTRRYRYVKAFTIRPETALPGMSLDFGRENIRPAILRGYQDACLQVEAFLAYARRARFPNTRRLLRLTPGTPASLGSKR